MKINKIFWNSFLTFSLFLILGGQAFSDPPPITRQVTPDIAEKFSKKFQHIVIDARGARGGMGDIAAHYLVVQDLLQNMHYTGKITWVMGPTSKKILENLLGQAVQNGKCWGVGNRVQCFEKDFLPPDLPPADLYIALARNSGREATTSLLDVTKGRAEGKIPIRSDTVRITQPVLGDTESPSPRSQLGQLRMGDLVFQVQCPGLGCDESGVYPDTVAMSLRGKSQSEVKDSLIQKLGQSGAVDSPEKKQLSAVIKGQVLQGARIGLVYGISAKKVKEQFQTYLNALSYDMDSFVLVTPSKFSREDVNDSQLGSKLIFLRPGESMPKIAQPGKIYILNTPPLPQEIFVGLMAYSQIPPVVAGDGALSAALIIGKPFVLTEVAWNRINNNNLKNKLEAAGVPRGLLSELYGGSGPPNFRNVLNLYDEKTKNIFFSLQESTPLLTDQLIEAAHALRSYQEDIEIIQAVRDPVLKIGLALDFARKKPTEARLVIIDLIEKHPSEASKVIAIAGLPAELKQDLEFQKLMINRYLLAEDVEKLKIALEVLRFGAGVDVSKELDKLLDKIINADPSINDKLAIKILEFASVFHPGKTTGKLIEVLMRHRSWEVVNSALTSLDSLKIQNQTLSSLIRGYVLRNPNMEVKLSAINLLSLQGDRTITLAELQFALDHWSQPSDYAEAMFKFQFETEYFSPLLVMVFADRMLRSDLKEAGNLFSVYQYLGRLYGNKFYDCFEKVLLEWAVRKGEHLMPSELALSQLAFQWLNRFGKYLNIVMQEELLKMVSSKDDQWMDKKKLYDVIMRVKFAPVLKQARKKAMLDLAVKTGDLPVGLWGCFKSTLRQFGLWARPPLPQ